MKEISKTVYQSVRTPFVYLCIGLGVTANQITLFNHLITLTLGCYFFATGEWLFGLVVCLINGFLDYLDGDVAKETGKFSNLGIWLDSGFDVIIQSAVMGAIGLGCYKAGLSVEWIVLFMISNAANNFVSFNYNQKFAFDSDKGNELFRKIMGRKCHILNIVLRDMIDPTSNYLSLMLYTYRYWIVLGVFTNMVLCFKVMAIISTVKWIVMFTVYCLYLMGEKRLFVLKALSALDEETEDFYQLRHS